MIRLMETCWDLWLCGCVTVLLCYCVGSDEYFRMKLQWKSVSEEQERRNSRLRDYRSLIGEKHDVQSLIYQSVVNTRQSCLQSAGQTGSRKDVNVEGGRTCNALFWIGSPSVRLLCGSLQRKTWTEQTEQTGSMKASTTQVWSSSTTSWWPTACTTSTWVRRHLSPVDPYNDTSTQILSCILRFYWLCW